MIQKIDIEKFGVFTNYKWNDCFKEKPYFFGRGNIIYGRNYSGKTTLSRIFRSLELGELHKDYSDGKFTITLENGKKICEKDVEDKPLKIRVYNSDFVKDNIKFESGEMKPFAVIGEKNIEIVEQIKQENAILEKKINRLENPEMGLKKQYEENNSLIEKLEKELNNLLKEKAREIRNDPTLFMVGEKNKYDVRDIIDEIKYAAPIDENEEKELEETLKEDVKKIIPKISKIDIDYMDYLKRANKLLSMSVKPSKIIPLLANNHELQEWVREGITHHRYKLEQCAFCGNPIKEKRWEELDNHFTNEVERYTKKLDNMLKELRDKMEYIENYELPISKDNLYAIFEGKYNEILVELTSIKNMVLSKLKDIDNVLKERRQNLFSTSQLIEADEEIGLRLKDLVSKVNQLIKENNEYTKEYTERQNQARKKLRYNEIYKFLKLINYIEKEQEIQKVRKHFNELTEEIDQLIESIESSRNRIDVLEKLMKDERRSIDLINDYLLSYIAHPQLHLEFEEDKSTGKVTKFVIKRNGVEAKNLSEGEQSLLAFCYFLAQLESIENPEEYIIYIDDPISSLDTNHIFYIFGLINSEIARKKYKQVFISTHNLDFLSYLYMLSIPDGDNRNNKKYKKKFYFINKKMNNYAELKSELIKMPQYIREYFSEFIYLFRQIYRVYSEEQTDDNFEVFYTYPNTARKFLETYMIFKFPDVNKKHDDKLLDFFDGKKEIVSFLNRIINEYSHGQRHPERLFRPIDIPEFKKSAKLILDYIQKKDPQQYYAFLNSIKEDLDIKSVNIENVKDEFLPV